MSIENPTGWEKVALHNIQEKIDAESLLNEIKEDHFDVSEELQDKVTKLLEERGWL